MRYKLSIRAEKDILEIFSYGLTNFGAARTEKYYLGLDETFSLIADNPEIGRRRPDIDAATRSFVHQSHVIYYKIQADFILIVRILGEKQDPLRHMELD